VVIQYFTQLFLHMSRDRWVDFCYHALN